MWRHPLNCLLNNRPPGPGLCPLPKNRVCVGGILKPADEALLGQPMVACQQKREQVKWVNAVRKDAAEIGAGRIGAWVMSCCFTCAEHFTSISPYMDRRFE